MRFRRPDTGDEVEAVRGNTSTGLVWRTPGDGRAVLDGLFAVVRYTDLAHLTTAITEGRVFERTPPDAPGRWVVDTRMPDAPERYRAWAPGEERVTCGPRADLLAAAEVLLRVALAPYEGQGEVPGWVADCRLAHVLLLAGMAPRARMELAEG